MTDQKCPAVKAAGSSPLQLPAKAESSGHLAAGDTGSQETIESSTLNFLTAPTQHALVNTKVGQDSLPAYFPKNSQDEPLSPKSTTTHDGSTEEQDGSRETDALPGVMSPASLMQGQKNRVLHRAGKEGMCRIHKFWLYETANRFYVVGGDVQERKFRLLKIDRFGDKIDLSITEDDIVYTKRDMNQLLDTLGEGNKGSGGMKLKYSFWGLLGFVRFTGVYYMLVITKKSAVAVIGGHFIYQIDGSELIPLASSAYRSKADKDPEETRFIGILNNLDLTRSFYFSYSYDVTRTLQHNIIRERRSLGIQQIWSHLEDYNSMFVWNHHFLRPVSAALKTAYDWCLPVVHGFVDQASKDVKTSIVMKEAETHCRDPRLRSNCIHHYDCKTITFLCRSSVSETRSKRLGRVSNLVLYLT